MPVFKLEIVTPARTVYSGTVESLRAPGSEGSFGVLARHQPLLAALSVGEIRFREENRSARKAATSGGFAEVLRDRVVVLAETAELTEEIDVARAEAARDRALERLSKRHDPKIDAARAEAALSRAMNRLRVAGK